MVGGRGGGGGGGPRGEGESECCSELWQRDKVNERKQLLRMKDDVCGFRGTEPRACPRFHSSGVLITGWVGAQERAAADGKSPGFSLGKAWVVPFASRCDHQWTAVDTV